MTGTMAQKTPQADGTRDAPDHGGHRERLRERLFRNGPAALDDYELLELLLTPANPRGDIKPLAKTLLRAFGGSLPHALAATPEELRKIAVTTDHGAGPRTLRMTDTAIAVLHAARALALRMLREEARTRPQLSSWKQLIEYCQAALKHEKAEQFRVLFLDKKNKLMADEVQQRGTVDHTPVYPREVVKRALELGASAMFLVHNHPSGDPTPSRADIEMTKEVQKAAATLGLVVHDHVIVGGDGNASLRSLGLM